MDGSRDMVDLSEKWRNGELYDQDVHVLRCSVQDSACGTSNNSNLIILNAELIQPP